MPKNKFLDLVDIIGCNVLASTGDDHILDPSADSHKTVVNRCLKHKDLITIDEDRVHEENKIWYVARTPNLSTISPVRSQNPRSKVSLVLPGDSCIIIIKFGLGKLKR